MTYEVQKTDAEWRAQLTPEQYRVTREKATERPFTGALNYNKESGIYTCVACGAELFSSEQKYDSGSGWPSFWAALNPENVGEEKDRSLFMVRTEVHCAKCGAHLGHLFDDGPQLVECFKYSVHGVASTLALMVLPVCMV